MGFVLPPGPRYLAPKLPTLILPPTLVCLLLTSPSSPLATSSLWLVVLACALSWPIVFTVLVHWRSTMNARAARRRGAVVPEVRGSKLPGGVDAIARMFVADKTKYLAETAFEAVEHGGHTFNLRVMFEDRIFTTEPEYIKTMLATEFNNYDKGPLLASQLDTLLGSGVFNSDGEIWKFHRTMTRPFFSKDRITHFELFDRHAEHALDKVSERLKEGVAVDWQDIVSRFTMDCATEFLFGKDVRSLDAPIPYPSTHRSHNVSVGKGVHPADRFVRAFQNGLEATAIRGRFLQAWPLVEFWGDRVAKELGAVHEFIDPIVDSALREKAIAQETGVVDGEKVGEKEVHEEDTLLAHLVKFTDDRKVIKDETLNILLAGRDTTSCTLTFSVYALAEHPAVLERLRKEVLSVVGASGRPSYSEVKELKYMRAFINEVLRLYPPVPFDTRCSTSNGLTWKNTALGEPDLYIPPRTRCLYSVLVMHRRKDLWGPDAFTFDPDRFLDERLQKYLVPNPFIFLPFNAGPRICLGQQFAYNEISFMLVRLLQRFSVIRLRQDVHPESLPPLGVERSPYAVNGRERVWMKSHLTTYANNGLWVEMDEVSRE